MGVDGEDARRWGREGGRGVQGPERSEVQCCRAALGSLNDSGTDTQTQHLSIIFLVKNNDLLLINHYCSVISGRDLISLHGHPICCTLLPNWASFCLKISGSLRFLSCERSENQTALMSYIRVIILQHNQHFSTLLSFPLLLGVPEDEE